MARQNFPGAVTEEYAGTLIALTLCYNEAFNQGAESARGPETQSGRPRENAYIRAYRDLRDAAYHAGLTRAEGFPAIPPGIIGKGQNAKFPGVLYEQTSTMLRRLVVMVNAAYGEGRANAAKQEAEKNAVGE